MTNELAPRADQDPVLTEIGGDLQREITRFVSASTREWRVLVGELERKVQAATWKPDAEREHLTSLLEFTRQAVGAFERITANGPPKHDHLTPHDFSWFDLTAELARDETAGRALWDRIKETARDELAEGRTGALVVESAGSDPMARAEYLAVWRALADGLHPGNGAERLLIDAMAQALIMHRHWLHRMIQYDSLQAARLERSARERGQYDPPRLTEAETIERAMQMADRFQRQFVRVLKAYRDQRRVLGPVVVAAGGQLNVAEQQINVVTGGEDT